MKKLLMNTMLMAVALLPTFSLAEDQLTWEWSTFSSLTGCVLVSLSGDTLGTGTFDWGDTTSSGFLLTTGTTVSPICHTYGNASGRTVNLTTSGNFYIVDLTGQLLTSFSGGIATGLVYLGLANTNLSGSISAESFSGLESLQHLVINDNELTTEQYNAFLSGLSEQTLPNGVQLYVSPYQYGGCNVANREAGIAGRNKLTSPSEKGRIINDGGLANCPAVVPPTTSNGGGGGVNLKKDDCSDGDNSPSYYDKTCNANVGTGQALSDDGTSSNENANVDNAHVVSTEIVNAYEWALQHGITTISTLENADPDGLLLHSHLAKMIVNYVRVLEDRAVGYEDKANLVPTERCAFNDIANETPELQSFIIQACELGLMGIHSDGTPLTNFTPNKTVSRAEFGTVLSRLLRGTTYNEGTPYYLNHLQALKANGIMTQIDNPEKTIELRQWVWLMLIRSTTTK